MGLLMYSSYHMKVDEQTGGVFLYDQGGFIVTRKEAEELFSKMQMFFDSGGDRAIQAHNQELIDKMYAPREVKPKKDRTAQAGYVYLLRIKGQDLYKVGMTTKKPTERLAQFTPKMPYESYLVGTIKTADALGLERDLHGYYTANGYQRVSGEWFNLDGLAIQHFFYIKENEEK